MKNRVSTYFGVVSAIILALIILLAYFMRYHPEYVAPLDTPAQQALLQHHLIVVDFDDKGLVNEAELLQGKDAVIAVKNPKPSTAAAEAEEVFNSVAALQKLDANKDGRLDAKDPIFPSLQLIYMTNNGKTRRYETFTAAGIVAIQFNQERLNQQKPDKQLILTPANNLIGKAIFKDGTQHDIRLIIIEGQAD